MGENPGALRHDVEEARAHLGDTVDALAYKVSAPRRAAERVVAEARDRVTPATAVVAACVVVGLLALFVRRAR